MKTPYCQGGGEPTTARKRTVCPHCGHVVAIKNGRIAMHWWSRGTIIHRPRE